MSANEMWGGRYAAGPSAVMERINASIGFDWRLYAQDIVASKAHCAMLVDQGIVSAGDGAAIQDGLDAILKEIESESFEFKSIFACGIVLYLFTTVIVIGVRAFGAANRRAQS